MAGSAFYIPRLVGFESSILFSLLTSVPFEIAIVAEGGASVSFVNRSKLIIVMIFKGGMAVATIHPDLFL